jgi:hypothetical protein
MKKQIISFLTAASLAAMPVAALANTTEQQTPNAETVQTFKVNENGLEEINAPAANKVPSVIVNGRTIDFADQQPVIVNDRILVPARGVFEALEAKVSWDGEKQTARFDSANNITRVLVTINNPKMTVYTFTSLLKADSKEVDLDVPPEIINDRTMVPLRAISQSFGTTVNWDADSYTATISDKNYLTNKPSEDGSSNNSKAVTLSLAANKTEVAPNDELTLTISASNMEQLNAYLAGVTAGVYYDKSMFEFVGYTMMLNGKPVTGGLGASNPEYRGDSLKAIHITTDTEEIAKDGVVMELKFKALANTGKSSFKLSDRYTTDRGEDTILTIGSGNANTRNLSASECIVDTTPVDVEIKAAE